MKSLLFLSWWRRFCSRRCRALLDGLKMRAMESSAQVNAVDGQLSEWTQSMKSNIALDIFWLWFLGYWSRWLRGRDTRPVVGAVLTAQHHRAPLALDPDHQKWAVCHWHPVLLADESRFNHERICRCSGEHLQTTTSFSMIGLVLGHWWSGEAQTSTG